MKIYAIFLAFFCIVSLPLFALKGGYKIKKGIEKYDYEKAKRGMMLVGSLERKEKVRLLELLDEKIAQKKPLSMSGWDWMQVLTGTVMVLCYIDSVTELVEKKGLRAALGKAFMGTLGLGLIANGMCCRSARKPLNELQKIEVDLAAMAEREPDKVLQATETQSTGTSI